MAQIESTNDLRIVFMCTGNQARSVIAEHYTRKIAVGFPVLTESVGLLDTGGAPALPEAIQAARAFSLELGQHVSRPFTAIDLSAVDLVIGFEQQHMATAVVDGNADPGRTFKILELVRLLTAFPSSGSPGDPVANARFVIARAASARGGSTGFAPGEDLADPAGRNTAFFHQTANVIKEACDALISGLFPGAGQPSRARDSDSSSGARIWD